MRKAAVGGDRRDINVASGVIGGERLDAIIGISRSAEWPGVGEVEAVERIVQAGTGWSAKDGAMVPGKRELSKRFRVGDVFGDIGHERSGVTAQFGEVGPGIAEGGGSVEAAIGGGVEAVGVDEVPFEVDDTVIG